MNNNLQQIEGATRGTGSGQQLQLNVTVLETEDGKATGNGGSRRDKVNWWIRISLYTIFVIAGQTVATLLGRQYYDKGGNSTWLATLVQLTGFPFLLPFYFFSPLKNIARNTEISTKPSSTMAVAGVYLSLGLLVAVNCYMYSVGLLYLPVSTYSLICASQLAFNALFSYFLNSQKFTPYIVNSLLLLTLSSTLLVSDGDSSGSGGVSRGKYIIGFVCTVGASAGYALVLSLTQLAFNKVIKKQTFTAVMDMIIYQSVVATAAILIGLFASGEWKGLTEEMNGYKLGKISYMMNLIWTAITWQVFSIGAVGLIFEMSSLFSNAISVLGLPVIPVLAVIFFHDKMQGVKIVAMILAIWGFVSYIYQLYLDDRKEDKIDTQNQTSIKENASGVS